MAEGDATTGSTPPKRRADTGKRVVLQRVVGITEAEFQATEWTAETLPTVESWQVVEIVEADNDRAAIEKVAGKAGTAEAKPGSWKAIPLANWRGTAVYERPPEPIVGVSWSEE